MLMLIGPIVITICVYVSTSSAQCGRADLICRCWEDVDMIDYDVQDGCIYYPEETVCYRFKTTSGGVERARQLCLEINSELAEVHSALILDDIALLAKETNDNDEFWLNVPVMYALHNITIYDYGKCSYYNSAFALNGDECTFLEIKNDDYKIKKRRCDDDRDMGFICAEFLPIAPTTAILTTSSDILPSVSSTPGGGTRDIPIISVGTIPFLAAENAPTVSSQTSDSTIILVVSIALAIAVVCIVVLVTVRVCKRQTVHAQDATQHMHRGQEKNEYQYDDVDICLPKIHKSNGQSNVLTSGDIVQYSEYKSKTDISDEYTSLDGGAVSNANNIGSDEEGYVDNELYYPSIPSPIYEQTNAQHSPEYDSIGPQYDVLTRETNGIDKEKESEQIMYLEIVEGERKSAEDEQSEYAYAYQDFRKTNKTNE